MAHPDGMSSLVAIVEADITGITTSGTATIGEVEVLFRRPPINIYDPPTEVLTRRSPLDDHQGDRLILFLRPARAGELTVRWTAERTDQGLLFLGDGEDAVDANGIVPVLCVPPDDRRKAEPAPRDSQAELDLLVRWAWEMKPLIENSRKGSISAPRAERALTWACEEQMTRRTAPSLLLALALVVAACDGSAADTTMPITAPATSTTSTSSTTTSTTTSTTVPSGWPDLVVGADDPPVLVLTSVCYGECMWSFPAGFTLASVYGDGTVVATDVDWTPDGVIYTVTGYQATPDQLDGLYALADEAGLVDGECGRVGDHRGGDGGGAVFASRLGRDLILVEAPLLGLSEANDPIPLAGRVELADEHDARSDTARRRGGAPTSGVSAAGARPCRVPACPPGSDCGPCPVPRDPRRGEVRDRRGGP